MAGQEVGSLYYDLTVDDKNLKSQLDNADSKVRSFGNKITSSFAPLSQSFGGIASGIENVAKKVALLGVSSTAGLGVFVKSAADLQQTSKSFEVLTGNVDVANKLFAQLAKYANNTPFEFPQIAKAGQILLGFGIQSDQVFSKVTMLGDIAAATGADFESLALVFGQVNATGRLMGQDALQLINNKIPITSILAKKLGISVQEVKKQMEEGKIGVDVFNEALEGTTKAGGFAFKGTDILAQSLNGRLSTLKDTVLEFGRNLLGVKVDPELGLVIKPGGMFDRFSQAVPKLTANLQELGPKISGAFDFLIRNWPTIKAILAGIAAAYVTAKLAAIGFAIAASINLFTLIAAAVTGFIALMTFLQVKFDILGKAMRALQPVFNFLGDLFGDLFKEIGRVAQALGKLLAPVFEFVAKHADVFKKILLVLIAVALTPLALAIGAIVLAIKALTAILRFVADNFEGIKKAVAVALAVAFWPLTVAIGAIILVMKNWGAITNWLGDAFRAVAGVVSSVFSTIYNVITTVLNAIWSVVSPILNFIKNLFIIVFGGIALIVISSLQAVYNFVAPIFQAIWNVINTVVGFIWDRLVNAFNFYKDLIINTFNAVFGFISTIWNAIYGVISGVVKRIIDFFAPAFNWLYQKGKDVVLGLVNGIRAVGGEVWNAIKSVADKIGQFFGGAAGWLWDVGRAIVMGLVNGIRSAIGWVNDAAGNVADAVKNKLKGVLGIRSPSKVFMQYGRDINAGLVIGLEKTASDVMAAVTTPTMAINSSIAGNQAYSAIAAQGFGASAGATNNRNSSTNINGDIIINDKADADYLLERLNRDAQLLSFGGAQI